MQWIENIKRRWKQSDRLARIGAWILIIPVLLLIVIITVKLIGAHRESVQRRNELKAGPHVQVVAATPSPPERLLSLLGEARPYESATLYAKISGYLKEVRADKGDKVEQGQLLAVIESPETNQDYDAAVADERNKRAIAERIRPLLEQKLISQQEADQAFSDADQASARLGSLGAVKGYQEIRAPFTGVITARFADPGALVQSAANSQTAALGLFTLSEVNRLRIYVYVDQRDAAFVHAGLPVVINLQERPEFHMPATITRFSDELDEKTRMLLAEIDIDNHDNALVAGSFVQVSLKVQAPSYIEIPVESLIVKQGKTFVPVVTSTHTITYREITVADNDGEEVKVLSGLQAGEWVAMNIGTSVPEGATVQPVMPPPPAGAAPGSSGAPGAGSSSSASSGAPAAATSAGGSNTPGSAPASGASKSSSGQKGDAGAGSGSEEAPTNVHPGLPLSGQEPSPSTSTASAVQAGAAR